MNREYNQACDILESCRMQVDVGSLAYVIITDAMIYILKKGVE